MPSPSLSSSSTADPLGRRKLLVIYLHGFLGNDESFRSFPAHVHALLTNMLADSHVIHTKLYPRYKTYRAVDVARDNFSEWLAPHESPTTDVILVGHSMGGILAADIVLMPNISPYGQTPFKHRILGHVSLDCPFLGLHPGIIVSGISSLFKPAPQPQQPVLDYNSGYSHGVTDGLGNSISTAGTSSLSLTPGSPPSVPSSSAASISPALPPSDPYFNAPFFNDAAFREQPFVRRALHFAAKYRSENLFSATTKHFMSYLEYGGVLADPAGLEARYCHLRALEDVDELQPAGLGKDPRGLTTRVRFVNYYTLCTGRPKTPKPESPKSESVSGAEEEDQVEVVVTQNETIDTAIPTEKKVTEDHFAEVNDVLEPKSLWEEKDKLKAGKNSPGPSITVEDHDNSEFLAGSSAPGLATTSGVQSLPGSTTHDTASLPANFNELSMQEIDPTPMEEIDPNPMDEASADPSDATTLQTRPSDQSFELDLPPIPDEPTPPELSDLTQYTDKDSRKLAERENKRLQRVYDQAVKDRTKAINEREKIIEKRRKKASKDADRLVKEARKEAEKEEKEARKEVERLEKEARKEAERLEKEARKETERNEKAALKEQRRLEREAQGLREGLASPGTPNPPSSSAEGKPRKLRQFCNLPDPAPTAHGTYERDRTWVEVFMADVDEVGAHCGLFLPGPHYEQLVGDVGSRIVGWVQEDMTKRAIMEIGLD